ncbi:LacI family DNA-binding transcriptional regulator [Rhizobium sp. BK251]|uniref:LacI family DNA-binding transcriptional regulator n=1 Tax=Rhizobium sp. BK251 TaxID=2512125 RepID=UPI0010E27C52|nr:LacI family DNA-binding transcriptional regulator [Rhizobium sp. BK251]TCL68102.1 LacI family transcriptional regulator [Rhizobium sp. BK251]
MRHAGKQLRRSSIHDVASRAGVSPATVSKVLQGVTTVKAENVQRVHDAVEALDYRLDPFAADLRRSRRRIIGAIVPELESEFFGSMVTALERLAEKRGYALVAATSRESEKREAELIERMHDWRVAGVVLAPVRSEKGSGTALLKRYGMTGVLVDRVMTDDTLDTVSVDNASASAEVARQLVEAGHAHVLLLGLSDESIAIHTRIDSFRKAASQLDPTMKVDVLLAGGDVTALRAALATYFGEHKPTAIYSLFLKGTLVALTEFRRRGWHCPNDISLVGFDDAEWMQVTYPSIAAVVQPIDKMAEQAVDMLFRRIDGLEEPAKAHLEPCKVVMRESVGRMRQHRIEGEETMADPRHHQR